VLRVPRVEGPLCWGSRVSGVPRVEGPVCRGSRVSGVGGIAEPGPCRPRVSGSVFTAPSVACARAASLGCRASSIRADRPTGARRPGMVARRGKRRARSEVGTRMIGAQARVPGISVSQVARRCDVDTNLVFVCLRDPREARADEAVFSRSGRLGRPRWRNRHLTAGPGRRSDRRTAETGGRCLRSRCHGMSGRGLSG